MSRKKTKSIASETPPAKPWCYRVGRTGAKKFGARENWPSDWREARAKKRRAHRTHDGERAVAELLLIAESKQGGLEGQIARAKLRALKKERHITAEAMRSQIIARLTRANARRNSKACEDKTPDGNEEP